MAKTIEQIAEDLGTSVTTVRLVLLGKARQYRISVKTEEKVRAYTELHGYQINHTARSLRLQRTDSLALIVPRLSNHFFAMLAERLEIRCRAAGLQLFISCCHDDRDTQLRLIHNFHQRNIDGVFMIPADAEIPPIAAGLFNNRLVLLDRDFGLPDFSLVVTANQKSSYELTNTLYKLVKPQRDHPRITFLAGNPNMPSTVARLRGFQEALNSHEVPAEQVQIFTAPRNGFSEGVEVMNRYLQQAECPDILISSSISIFEGSIHSLRMQFGEIPPALVLATFDDHTMLDLLRNPVCSVRQDYEYIVNTAFAEMEKLIQGNGKPEHHTAAMEIISRNF